ncbi:hypothetical protein B0H19DRAFT_1058223 [Mycena capillaripes]|nr:hypothetical protein B0H19DRAFT_1058223 [Mycena capillaripes]
MAYANISGLMLFENARKATSKVTVIDVSVFIGPTEEDFLLGVFSYFNDGDTPVEFEDGIYYCQIRTVKREEGFQVHSGNPERYSFVGDLKTYFPVDGGGGACAYVHILGTVTKSNQDTATFEMEAEQYTLAHADAKRVAEDTAAKNGTLLRGFSGTLGYKNKKPVPYANKLVLIGAFLAGVSETLEGSTVKSRFRLEVDEVTFVTNPPLPALTSAITTPSSASGSGKGT